MKYLKTVNKYSIVLILIVLLVAPIIMFGCYGCGKDYKLCEGYIWTTTTYQLKRGGKEKIVSPQGNIVIGPSQSIELWAKYPWIYGYSAEITKNGTIKSIAFAVNTKTGYVKKQNLATSVYSKRKGFLNLGLPLVEFATLGDIIKSAQWYNKKKDKALKKALNPKSAKKN